MLTAVPLLALAACSTDAGGNRGGEPGESPTAPDDEVTEGAPAAAPALSVRPVAVRAVPGKDKGSVDPLLTRVLRKAVARTTGAPVVDEAAARATLDECPDPEAGCETPLMNDFLGAGWIVNARVDELGGTFYASGTVWEGTRVTKRVNAQAPEARMAVAQVGWSLGAAVRPRLELEATPVDEAPGPGTPEESTAEQGTPEDGTREDGTPEGK